MVETCRDWQIDGKILYRLWHHEPFQQSDWNWEPVWPGRFAVKKDDVYKQIAFLFKKNMTVPIDWVGVKEQRVQWHSVESEWEEVLKHDEQGQEQTDHQVRYYIIPCFVM